MAQKHKLSYKAWEEGSVPDYVLELLSRKDVAAREVAEARVAELEALLRQP